MRAEEKQEAAARESVTQQDDLKVDDIAPGQILTVSEIAAAIVVENALTSAKDECVCGLLIDGLDWPCVFSVLLRLLPFEAVTLADCG